MSDTNRNQELIDDARKLLDFLESHPDLPEVYFASSTCTYCFVHEPKELAKIARTIGSFDKVSDSGHLNLRKMFGSIKFDVAIRHDAICDKVITQRVVPAEPEKVIPAQVVPAKPERVIEVSEWVCPESILASDPPDEDDDEDDDGSTVDEPTEEPVALAEQQA